MTRLTRVAMVVGCTWGLSGLSTMSFAQEPAEQTQVESGSGLYSTYCAVCHGSDAKGTGPLAKSMRKRPPDLTALGERNGGTFPEELVYRMIDGRDPVKGHGGGDMPIWGDALSQSKEAGSPEVVKIRISQLVRYLSTIQKK